MKTEPTTGGFLLIKVDQLLREHLVLPLPQAAFLQAAGVNTSS